ncbi:MAG: glycosyltransferase [Acidimicrobiales bacterium]|jgi:glycosyltransferase involved in cell wall biosynthesis|nr:glycosyltransferase [Acidimicrobiales bacterium]
MRILVVPNTGAIGGSPLAALDLAVALRDRGHDVVVYVAAGPVHELARAAGLVVEDRPAAELVPPRSVVALLRVARRHDVDLVHAYEPHAIAEAFLGARLVGGRPLLGSVHSLWRRDDAVPPGVALNVGGRPALAAELRSRRPGLVVAVPPPVDVARDHPGVDGTDFRATYGIGPHELVVAVVSRLVERDKGPGIEATIEAVADLARSGPVRLVVVGDGPDRARFEAHAARVTAHGVAPPVFTGELVEPRPAYAAADIVIGQGTTVLRAMAHGRVAVVHDEVGRFCVVDERSIPFFREHGYNVVPTGGRSAGLDIGNARDRFDLRSRLEGLAADAGERRRLGRLGRDAVVQQRALPRVAAELEAVYVQVVTSAGPRRHELRAGLVTARELWRRRIRPRLATTVVRLGRRASRHSSRHGPDVGVRG